MPTKRPKAKPFFQKKDKVNLIFPTTVEGRVEGHTQYMKGWFVYQVSIKVGKRRVLVAVDERDLRRAP